MTGINATLILLPMPRQLEWREGKYKLASDKRIALLGAPAQELLFSGERLCLALAKHNIAWSLAATASGAPNEIGATLRVDAARLTNAEAYEITISETGIAVTAGSPRGIFYAVNTLSQIIAQSKNHVPFAHISDAPDFANRGVMLDVSRDKVPTMQTLFELIDLFANWKINQVQLYLEHTFAYRNHRLVWHNASPLTAGEILALDAYCRERFIELVPNQNSFGHLRPWLIHRKYRPLAEAPNGCDTRWGHFAEPFSLNPGDPRSLALVCEWYDELLPNFSSRQFNVGLDETIDLGQGRSQAEVKARGVGPVYLDYLKKIYREVAARNHTMMFWGDIITEHPELIPELPRDAVALEWGYEADHPFDENSAAYAQSGIPFYVCPGTSTWNTIAGRTDNALGNIVNAAENGLKHGAIGVLNTDWGDNHHWQYLPMSYLGFAYGAAVSWSLAANRALDIARAISLFAFDDATGNLGRVAYNLGNVYQAPQMQLHNSSLLFRLLQKPLDQIINEYYGLTITGLHDSLRAIDRAVKPLARAKSQRADAALILAEYQCAADLLRHGCRRGLLALETNAIKAHALKRELKRDALRLIKEYTRLWHARNRPGGFSDSVAAMTKMAKEYDG